MGKYVDICVNEYPYLNRIVMRTTTVPLLLLLLHKKSSPSTLRISRAVCESVCFVGHGDKHEREKTVGAQTPTQLGRTRRGQTQLEQGRTMAEEGSTPVSGSRAGASSWKDNIHSVRGGVHCFHFHGTDVCNLARHSTLFLEFPRLT
jgi:hypothetical protein